MYLTSDSSYLSLGVFATLARLLARHQNKVSSQCLMSVIYLFITKTDVRGRYMYGDKATY